MKQNPKKWEQKKKKKQNKCPQTNVTKEKSEIKKNQAYHGEKIDPSDDKDASSHSHFCSSSFLPSYPQSHGQKQREIGPKMATQKKSGYES